MRPKFIFRFISYMKENLTQELKAIIGQSIDWAKLEVEYVKLTAAEKISILAGTAVMVAIAMVMFLPVLIMLLFALVGVFRLIMPPALAYLTVAGIEILVVVIIYLLRTYLIFNPISRFITRLIIDKSEKNG